jgi:hypothetical protein
VAAADRSDLRPPPGRHYSFGWGSSFRKLTGPAIAATDLGAIDAVLVSHDHHGDNLDSASRPCSPAAGAVLTTHPLPPRPTAEWLPIGTSIGIAG